MDNKVYLFYIGLKLYISFNIDISNFIHLISIKKHIKYIDLVCAKMYSFYNTTNISYFLVLSLFCSLYYSIKFYFIYSFKAPGTYAILYSNIYSTGIGILFCKINQI